MDLSRCCFQLCYEHGIVAGAESVAVACMIAYLLHVQKLHEHLTHAHCFRDAVHLTCLYTMHCMCVSHNVCIQLPGMMTMVVIMYYIVCTKYSSQGDEAKHHSDRQ